MNNISELIEKHAEISEKIERVEDHPLLNEVFEQLGSDDLIEFFDTLNDVTRGGANAGFNGFIYHVELTKFFEENDAEIRSLLESDADQFGTDVMSMVAGFNCLQGSGFSKTDIAKVLYGDLGDCRVDGHQSIIDAVCWFVLENIAFLADV